MQVQPGNSLSAVLSQLVTGGNAPADSPSPEFTGLLAQLGAILERSSQKPYAAGGLPHSDPRPAQNCVNAVCEALLRGAQALRAQVQALRQGLPVEAIELPDGGPVQGLEGVREDLKAFCARQPRRSGFVSEEVREDLPLSAYLREALPEVVERLQAIVEAEGGGRQKLQLPEAIGEWVGHKRAQEAERVEPAREPESLDSSQDVLTFLHQVADKAEPLPPAAIQPDSPLAAAELPAQKFLEAVNALGAAMGAPLAELLVQAMLGETRKDGDQLALGEVSLRAQQLQTGLWEARAKDVLRISEPVENTQLFKAETTLESPADGSFQTDFQVADGLLLKPTVGEPNLFATGQRPELSMSSAPSVAVGTTPAPVPLGGGDKPALTLPLGHPQWADELGQRLIWLHGRAIQAAEIHLNPPHLGPVAVRIEMHEGETFIQFASPHAVVREAIEAALPRLKESLDVHGLPVSQVEVTHQSLEGRSHARGERSYTSAQEYQAAAEDGAQAPEQAASRLEAPLGSHLLSLYV